MAPALASNRTTRREDAPALSLQNRLLVTTLHAVAVKAREALPLANGRIEKAVALMLRRTTWCLISMAGSSAGLPPASVRKQSASTYVTALDNGPQVLNNAITTVVKQGTGTAWGIVCNSFDALVVNNRITQADKGIDYSGFSTGKYRDNTTAGVTTPYTGGTDIGNNN